MSIPILIAVYVLLVVVFYLPLFLSWLKQRTFKEARSQLFRGLISIFDNAPAENVSCAPETQMLYRRLVEMYPGLRDHYPTAGEALEDLLTSMDALPEAQFDKLFGVVPPRERRARIAGTLGEMKVQVPFSYLPSAQGSLLNVMKHAIEAGNAELATTTLGKIADELEILDRKLSKQAQRTQWAWMIAAVGVLSTIVFAIVTMVAFLAR